MYSTQIYLYQQKHEVLLLDLDESVSDLRWRPVYSKNLKLNKGVDNVILFQFYNQDQKPVDISDSNMVFRLIDQTGQQLLLTTELEPVNLLKGKMKLVLRSYELNSIPTQVCSYSISRVRDEGIIIGDSSIMGQDFVEPIFVDDHAGARGVVEVLDSSLPAYVPSTEITVPDQYEPDETVYSSNATQQVGGVTTFQVFFDQYSGTVEAEGSVSPYGQWFAATTEPIVVEPSTASIMLTVEGHYDRIRLKFVPESGSIARILSR